jgi:ribosomal protein S18 acetylase RimI-like enzyme
MDSLRFVINENKFITNILGVNVGTILVYSEEPEDINSYDFENLISECKKLYFDLISIRINAEHIDLVIKFQRLGFVVMENLITFRGFLHKSKDYSLPSIIRKANAEDETALRNLAGSAFSFDRFHRDPKISSALANKIKSEWVANALHGRSESVFVYEIEEKVIGFNACLLSDDIASIDLIAVDSKFQGRGVGKELVLASQGYYSNFAQHMVVGTQSSNIKSMNFYHKLGFSISKSEFTLHGKI